MSCDDEVRMFSLVFDSSGLTPPMLTPLDDYFQNLMANISHGGVAEAILTLSQLNVGEDTFPDPVNPFASPVTVVATVVGSQEEGEVLASQKTAGPSSQRFSVETPQDGAGKFGDGIGVVTSSGGGVNLGGEVIKNISQVVLENIMGVKQDAAVCASKVVVPGAKSQKIKSTTTFVLDFDESDDEVHDEEAKHDRASRLSESTINVNTGERVSYQLEKGVSTGDFILLLHIFLFCFIVF
jgi:hypothetical protein